MPQSSLSGQYGPMTRVPLTETAGGDGDTGLFNHKGYKANSEPERDSNNTLGKHRNSNPSRGPIANFLIISRILQLTRCPKWKSDHNSKRSNHGIWDFPDDRR